MQSAPQAIELNTLGSASSDWYFQSTRGSNCEFVIPRVQRPDDTGSTPQQYVLADWLARGESPRSMRRMRVLARPCHATPSSCVLETYYLRSRGSSCLGL